MPPELLYFVPALLLSLLTSLFLPSSCVSLSYFILAVPMRECFGNKLGVSSPFPIAILNGTPFFLYSVQEKLNMPSGRYCRHCSRSASSNHLIWNLSRSILAVPIRKCLRKRSCTSSTFLIGILNSILPFKEAEYSFLWLVLRLSKTI